MKIEDYFTPEEKEKIRQAVIAAERRSSGEIVPMIISESDRYAEVEIVGLVAGMLIATAAALFLADPSIPAARLLAWPLAGASFLFLLCRIPAVKRRLIPETMIAEAVGLQSLAAFTAQGLHYTEAHTGILIFASLFEHQVIVLADRGIHEKVPAGTWDEVVQILTSGLKSGDACAAFCRAIERCGEILAAHFPRRSDDRDELANKLITGE